ncbi:MAG: ATP-NAD/AcoX kinase [Thermomicrobiales bacterium]|nr:ATP-NAD/AcoX kinase [Thermomicrobiales bacterium]MCD6056986.1 ATP-NAD/AcoX kinase [Thermomicrobiales bacterium]MDF3015547.1 ATP-NAD/AcoX kinase [Thermomicrobiales bacterium]
MRTSTVPHPQSTLDKTTAKPQRVGLIAARSKGEAQELSAFVSRALDVAGAEVIEEENLASGAHGPVDAIVVLGGDGLMIRVANSYPGIPLLGINFGNVGFLALVERRDWQRAIDALLAGDYSIQQGRTLQATLLREGHGVPQGWAINDVVVRSGMRMVDIEIYIDGHYVNTYPGDGMIVATPHGSTAYCMAAGGPILTAGVKGFAIVPISCHSPIRTPFVVSEEAVIEMVVANDHDSALILDGREQAHLERWDIVRVSRGEHAFKLVTLKSTNFYEAFRTKFNFRIRPDAIPSRDNRKASNGNPSDARTESGDQTLKTGTAT